MAATNGLTKGEQAAKIDAYPVLNQDSGTFFAGSGVGTAISNATSSKGGFMPAADKAFLDAFLAGTLANPSFNATIGAAEYKYNNKVILSHALHSMRSLLFILGSTASSQRLSFTRVLVAPFFDGQDFVFQRFNGQEIIRLKVAHQ